MNISDGQISGSDLIVPSLHNIAVGKHLNIKLKFVGDRLEHVDSLPCTVKQVSWQWICLKNCDIPSKT